MTEGDYDVIIIGGGPAGLAAGGRAKELNLDPLIVENDERIGGIPVQCAHPGFGTFYYNEDLTGPEFSQRLVDRIEELGVDYITKAHVTEITLNSDSEKKTEIVTEDGISEYTIPTIVYTAGARERHVYETGITGDRVSGIYTAGETQTLMDIHGGMPGKEIVIVGSGDVGLIMARRFALEGAEVKGVMEMLPYPGGLTRNIVQCLRDFNIPLYKKRAVKRIIGDERVEKIVTTDVDENLEPIEGSEKEIECDTVVLATGLIPYIDKLREIGMPTDDSTSGPVVNDYLETELPGIFVAGNSLAINDYVDYVAEQGESAARGAKSYLSGEFFGTPSGSEKKIEKGRNIRLAVPQYVTGEKNATIYARVETPESNVTVRLPEINKKFEESAVNPGEMLKIELEREEINRAKNKISLEVTG